MISGGGSPDGAYPGHFGDFFFDLYVAGPEGSSSSIRVERPRFRMEA